MLNITLINLTVLLFAPTSFRSVHHMHQNRTFGSTGLHRERRWPTGSRLPLSTKSKRGLFLIQICWHFIEQSQPFKLLRAQSNPSREKEPLSSLGLRYVISLSGSDLNQTASTVHKGQTSQSELKICSSQNNQVRTQGCSGRQPGAFSFVNEWTKLSYLPHNSKKWS